MNKRVHDALGGALLGAAILATGAAPVWAQTFSSGSTGADGAFSPSSNTVLTLPASGIFNFTTMNIPSGVTVTFTKNAANTPAVLLATGNVTINGTLSVSGSAAGALGRPGPGGPGGFDGGPGADGVTVTAAGTGLGPGGGLIGTNCVGSGGSHATVGGIGSGNCVTPGGAAPTYGSPTLRPILGGSGGSGGSACCLPGDPAGYGAGGAGGGGGGALVVASSGTLTVGSTGQLVADGGAGGANVGLNTRGGGGGSGGAIRLIATTLATSGALYARGGSGGQAGAGTGGLGRIRLEAYNLTVSGTRSPEATQSLPLSVFPAAGQPALSIASVAAVAVPATPSGSFLTAPDVLLPSGTTNPVPVVLSAANVPLGTTIQVTATPQSGAKTTATSTGLAGTFASSTATATLTVSLTQTSVLTATATFPLVASAGEGPLYAAGPVPSLVEGEEVTHVRLVAALGGPTITTYLTRSGREIPGTSVWR
jgi:hypothetical protein